jgi:hypothetical protein
MPLSDAQQLATAAASANPKSRLWVAHFARRAATPAAVLDAVHVRGGGCGRADGVRGWRARDSEAVTGVASGGFVTR